MPRRRNPSRVLGPYPKRSKWRLVFCDEGGAESYVTYETKEEAEQVKKALQRQLKREAIPTLAFALEEYETYLREVKQNKPQSVKTTLFRLRTFFPDQEMTLLDVTPKYAAATYMNVAKAQATDTHRNQLAEVKTFFRWCVKAKKWLKENPIEEIEGVGKRRHGKPQLRIDEARRWLDAANELAGQGDEGAIGAMATLLLGLRAGEVVSRVVRDLDDGGRLLWIPCSKTEAGRRTLEVPDLLRPHLLALTEAKLPTAPLFGLHWRDWPRKQVARICQLGKVPKVCAHAMRGLHGTLAIRAGTTPHVVAASLGHETAATTLQSYASPGSAHHAGMGRVLTLLKGGQGKN